MTIHLHIENLTLDGVDLDAEHQGQFQAALEAELGRLMAANALPPRLARDGAWESLPAATITVSSDPVELGHRTAHAVYGALQQ
ncbi:MAG: hypothetical protein GYB65_19790 [Chloroflexi bacterium]|nr:hypothetical protein [Chloroflexota bacterium]